MSSFLARRLLTHRARSLAPPSPPRQQLLLRTRRLLATEAPAASSASGSSATAAAPAGLPPPSPAPVPRSRARSALAMFLLGFATAGGLGLVFVGQETRAAAELLAGQVDTLAKEAREALDTSQATGSSVQARQDDLDKRLQTLEDLFLPANLEGEPAEQDEESG